MAKRKKKNIPTIVPLDLGTAERHKKGDDIELIETAAAGVKVARGVTASVLHTYCHRNQIGPRQFEAGQLLYRDWRGSGREPSVIASYATKTDPANDVTERAAAAWQRYTRAMEAVPKTLRDLCVHVCLLDNSAGSWIMRARNRPAREGISLLRVVLDELGDHYRLPISGSGT